MYIYVDNSNPFKPSGYILYRQFSCSEVLRSACFVMTVYPSVRVEQPGPTGRVFMKFDTSVFFENLSSKFKLH